jgi:dTDP-4-dehydrorhamnose reductase
MIDLAKSPERWPTQNSWTNRIHRDDAAAFIVFLTSQVLTSQLIETCYIVTDSNPVSQFEVLCWIAEKMNIKTEIIVPAIQGGKRLSNCRLLATGFKLQYPDYRAGYSALLLMNAAVSLRLR